MAAGSSPDGTVSNHSPWVAELRSDDLPRPLETDAHADIVVIGAGIAGIATSFFILRHTDLSVMLLERGRPGRGASGHNAGQLTTYFERPLHDIATEFGTELAIAAQRDIDHANDLLDAMAAGTGATVRVERFTGRLGVFGLAHLESHLHDNWLRQQGGLDVPECLVSDSADFLAHIPTAYAGLYSIVTQQEVDDLLGDATGRYRAVLSQRAGCANSALLVEQVLESLEREHAGRFTFRDHSPVERIVLGEDDVTIEVGRHRVRAAQVVLCTNGYTDHLVVDSGGRRVDLASDPIQGCVGYMAAFFEPEPQDACSRSFVRNDVLGGNLPYVYVTRRTYDRNRRPATLTCVGGPSEAAVGPEGYDASADVPAEVIDDLEVNALPLVAPSRPADAPLDFAWHGLMGYTSNGIRVIGRDPRDSRLMYNLGCNGVGFLPSIHGGDRIARLLRGDHLAPSIFDPRPLTT